MSQIDGRYIKADPVTIITDGLGRLKQTPGTDGGGGGGSSDIFTEELPLASNILLGYIDLTNIPLDREAIELYVRDVGGGKSPRQILTSNFTVVRNDAEEFRRIVWDSTLLPNQGLGAPIPFNDLPPTDGMQSDLIASDSFLLYYPI